MNQLAQFNTQLGKIGHRSMKEKTLCLKKPTGGDNRNTHFKGAPLSIGTYFFDSMVRNNGP